MLQERKLREDSPALMATEDVGAAASQGKVTQRREIDCGVVQIQQYIGSL